MVYASKIPLLVLRMSLLGSWIVALIMLSISPWRTPFTNSSGSQVFKQANAASAAANRIGMDLSLTELTRYVRMPGNLVDPIISIKHAFPRAEKTLFDRIHWDRRVGIKTGTSGANDDWSDCPREAKNSSETPESLERSELRQLMRGLATPRINETNSEGNSAAPLSDRYLRRVSADVSLSHVSSDSGRTRSSSIVVKW
jgi:hypothetical protein